MDFFTSYSHYGEDSMLSGVFKRLSWVMNQDLFLPKTYIDLGCYLPIHDSNTYFLYNLGWSGTMIDANPAMESFIKNDRPRDIFFNFAATADSLTESIILNIFDDMDSSNTTSIDFLNKISYSQNKTSIKSISVKTKTLAEIIDIHIANFDCIPFLINIDIEGEDYNTLSSYNWKYRPPFILVEDDLLGAFENSKIKEIMKENSYSIISSNFITSLYVDEHTDYFLNIKNLGPKNR